MLLTAEDVKSFAVSLMPNIKAMIFLILIQKKQMMNIASHKHLRLIPAVYFMLLGIFFIVMELSHNGFSFYWFGMYAFLFLPVLIPLKLVWTLFGLVLSFVFGLFLLNGFIWFTQYLNGAYFKYPFDTFFVGFPFIIWTLLCAMSICHVGLTARDNILLRIKKAE